MDPDEHELALRAHIRYLLLDYARTHLTKDYQTFTEDAVSELLSGCLCYVSTTDPTSLTLPEDPFDTLSRTLGLLSLKPYEEKWPTDRDAIQLLRKSLASSGKPRTERCWDEDTEFDYNNSIYRPMAPVLTTRAIRETPKPGSGITLKLTPKSQGELLKSFKRVDPEVFDDPPRVKLEDALKLRPAIDATTHSSMLSLYKSVPGMCPPQTPHQNTNIEAFLRSDSPSPTLLRSEFVPLFVRVDRLGEAKTFDDPKPVHHSIPSTLSDLPSMLPESKIQGSEDKDIYKQHMVVVDGWQTFAPSPPSSIGTPSLGSGTSEIDELFLVSPPTTQPAFIQQLMASRIDETEIPRYKKFGGTAEQSKLIGEDQNLGSFLSPFVSGPIMKHGEASNPRIVTTPRSSPSSSINLSILGQPSSLHETIHPFDPTHKYSDEEDPQMDLDAAVSRLYANVRERDPADLILNERLDERGGLLMDVPNMPQPNVHSPNPMFLPIRMRALLHSSIKSQFGDDHHGTLKKVTGLKLLNMELSWTPYKEIPTYDAVARVEGAIDIAELANIDNTKLTALLERAAVSSNVVDTNTFRGWDCLDESIKSADLVVVGRFDAMLTREERRRLGSIPDDIEDDDQAEFSTDSLAPQPLSDFDVDRGKSERDKAESQYLLADGLAQGLRSAQGAVPLDDSGVSFAHLANAVDNNSPDQDQLIDGDCSPQETDKENMPPVPDFSTSQLAFDTQNSYSNQERLSCGVRTDDTGYGSFVPLSFDSSHGHSNYPSQHHTTEQEKINDEHARMGTTYLDEPSDTEGNPPQHCPNREALIVHSAELTDVVPHSDFAHHASGSNPGGLLANTNSAGRSLSEFLALRNKSVNQDSYPPAFPQTVRITSEPILNDSPTEVYVTPEGIFDRNTLLLPSPWPLPPTLHRYLASLDILQKRSIVRSLGFPECAVELVERDTLGGVDLVLDPHTAVIFVSLMALPSQRETLTARLGEQSWRYSRLLVIFEAFSGSLAHKSDPASTRLAPNPYTPPILKTIKKLRRDLGIAEALETKNARSSIHFAFADSVHEAALFTRFFGDCAEANDTTGGAIWGTREWLDVDEQEGEQDLASIDGMNVFAASLILRRKPLQGFLDLTTESRVLEFGHLVGRDRVILFNEVLGCRYQALLSPVPSSPSYMPFSFHDP